MTWPTADDLLALAARMRTAGQLLRASVRTPAAGPLRVRARSAVRTHDRMGSAPAQPGDPIRLMVLRELANRNLLVVKTYHAYSEAWGQVVIDTSPGLLDQPAAGPFAVGLGFAVAAAVAWTRQPVGVSFLRGWPPAAVADRPSRLPAIAAALAAVRAGPADPEPLLVRLRRDLGRPRANANLFLLTHPGRPVPEFEPVLREIGRRARRAAVFTPVGEDEFGGEREVTHPATGRPVPLPRPAGELLAEHLNALVALGGSVGVPVVPLVVRDPGLDLETILPHLAGALP